MRSATFASLSLLSGLLLALIGCGRSEHRDRLNPGHPPTAEETELILAAVQRNDRPEVEKLIRANPATVNARGDRGWGPLHQAAVSGAVEIGSLLIARGAEVNARNQDGKTPLHEAARVGDVGLAEVLIDNGAQVNAKDTGTFGTFHASGRTPLHWAVCYVHAGMVKLLLERGADRDASDDEGQASLHLWAHTAGGEDVAEVLLAKGADVNARTTGIGSIYEANLRDLSIRHTPIPRGVTPLGVAILAKNQKTARFLREHGGKE